MFDDVDTYSKELYDKIMVDAYNICCDIIITSKTQQPNFENIVIQGLSEVGQRHFLGNIIAEWKKLTCKEEQYYQEIQEFFSNLNKVSGLKELCIWPMMLKYAFKSIRLRYPNRYQIENDYKECSCIRMMLDSLWREYLMEQKQVDAYAMREYTTRGVEERCDEELLFMEHLALSLMVNDAHPVKKTVAYVEDICGLKCVCHKKLRTVGLIHKVQSGVYDFVSDVIQNYFAAHFLLKYLVQRYPVRLSLSVPKLTQHNFDVVSPSMDNLQSIF